MGGIPVRPAASSLVRLAAAAELAHDAAMLWLRSPIVTGPSGTSYRVVVQVLRPPPEHVRLAAVTDAAALAERRAKPVIPPAPDTRTLWL